MDGTVVPVFSEETIHRLSKAGEGHAKTGEAELGCIATQTRVYLGIMVPMRKREVSTLKGGLVWGVNKRGGKQLVETEKRREIECLRLSDKVMCLLQRTGGYRMFLFVMKKL